MSITTLRHRIVSRLLRPFHRDESGATLTEFVITLPIWIVMLGGLLDLGKVGMNTTANKLETQTELWNKVVDASTGQNEDFMFPVYAGKEAVQNTTAMLNKPGNPHRVATGANDVVMVGLGADGTLGESAARTLPLKLAPGNTIPDLHIDPKKVLEVGSTYPHKVTHDGVVYSSWKNGGGGQSLVSKFASYLGSALAASGAVASLGAGIRYGEVYAATEHNKIEVMFGQTIDNSSFGNLLVAPSPLTGKDAERHPYLINRLLAEGEHNYSVMMNFGDSEWDNKSGGSRSEGPGFDEDEFRDKIEDDAEEEEEKGEKCKGENPPSYCDSFCAESEAC